MDWGRRTEVRARSDRNGNGVDDVVDDRAGVDAHGSGAFACDESVREDHACGALDVVGEDVISITQECEGLAEGLEVEATTRTCSVFERFGGAGGLDDIHEIAEQGFFDAHGLDCVLNRDERVAVHDGLDPGEWAFTLLHAQHAHFGGAIEVADAEPNHETIHLGEWQRIGAFELDGILGGENEEGSDERMDCAVDRDVVFFHGLEQAGLGSWRGAIDLIAEEDIGKNRPSAERKVVSILRIDRNASDI